MVDGRSWLTDRLRLVPIGPEHVDDLVALHADEAVAAWSGGPWSVADARRRAEWAQQRWREVGVDKWMAYDRSDGSLVGRGGVSLQVVDGAERLEVGWTVASRLWGRGYASEIGRAGLEFAFTELAADEVVAFTEPDNRRSLAVMHRLGMRYVKRITHHDLEKVLYSRAEADAAPARDGHRGTDVGDDR